MGDVQSPRCCRAASSDPGGHPGRGEAPSWGSRGGPGRGREVAVGRTEWTEGVRSEEKSCGLKAGAGSGPGAASGLASLRAAAGAGSSAEAGRPRRAPRLHSPQAGLQGARLFRSFEKLSYSSDVADTTVSAASPLSPSCCPKLRRVWVERAPWVWVRRFCAVKVSLACPVSQGCGASSFEM